MKNIFLNKKGNILPRNIIFMIFIFAGIVALSGIFINQMALEYGNTNMSNSYNQDTIGSDLLQNKSNVWEEISEDLSGDNGVIKMLTGGLTAIGQILLNVIAAPATFSQMVVSTLDILGTSENLKNIIGFFLGGILYAVIIFGIVKVFLRGGDI